MSNLSSVTIREKLEFSQKSDEVKEFSSKDKKHNDMYEEIIKMYLFTVQTYHLQEQSQLNLFFTHIFPCLQYCSI